MSYIRVMNNKNTQNGTPAPGAAVPEITTEKVTEYLKHDLSVAISCLTAIQSDPDLLQHMAIFMHGRMTNHQNKQVLEASDTQI